MEHNLLLLRKLLMEDTGQVNLLDEKFTEVKKPEKPIEPVRPKRCQHEACKMKLMLADFPCKCKNFYCSQHRYSESHKCNFDYKADGVKLLEKNLVQVNGSKLNKL
jgi:hypothetical protein